MFCTLRLERDAVVVVQYVDHATAVADVDAVVLAVDEHVEERKASEARRREKEGDADSADSLASHPDAPRREGCTVN